MEENTVPKSWWSRNWKWAVPVGGCLTMIILLIAFAGTLFVGITSIMKDSAAFNDALKKVKDNPELIEILGEPIEENGMTSGGINYDNGLKTAKLTIPIKGPKGEATIHVEGEGVGDTWTYQVMKVFVTDSNTVIDLLEEKKKLID